MPDPILIILHQEHSTPGRLGHALQRLGYTLDVRRPRFGEPLPPTMAEHSAAIIFGGPMSANDSDDFIRREIDWIGVPLRENKPFLGICLGAQLCAKISAAGSFVIQMAMSRSAITRCGRPRAGSQWCRPGRNTSTSGTAKDSTCRTAPSFLPRAIFSKCRRSAVGAPSRCSFIPK
jgi:aromatic ring-cleaving dioxygenase